MGERECPSHSTADTNSVIIVYSRCLNEVVLLMVAEVGAEFRRIGLASASSQYLPKFEYLNERPCIHLVKELKMLSLWFDDLLCF